MGKAQAERDLEYLKGAIHEFYEDQINGTEIQLIKLFKQSDAPTPTIQVQRKAGTGNFQERTSEFGNSNQDKTYDHAVISANIKYFDLELRVSEADFSWRGKKMEAVDRERKALAQSYINFMNGYLSEVIEDNTASYNGSGHSLDALYSSTKTIEEQRVFKYGTSYDNLDTGTAMSVDGLQALVKLGMKNLDVYGDRNPLNFAYIAVPAAQSIKCQEVLTAIWKAEESSSKFTASSGVKSVVKEGRAKDLGQRQNLGFPNTMLQMIVSNFLVNDDDYYLFTDPNVSPEFPYELWWHQKLTFDEPYIHQDTKARCIRAKCSFTPSRSGTRGAVKMDVS